MSLLEVMISLTIVTVVLVAVTMSIQREALSLSSVTRKTKLELSASEMLERVAETLEFAQGVAPAAYLSLPIGSTDAGEISVDTTAGFPDQGILLLEPGGAAEERIRYENTSASGFQNLERGYSCSGGASHAASTLVRWAGLATIIENQLNPAVEHYDGISQETLGQRYYRGDGYGFAFRNPVDPAGGTDFIDDTGSVRWGAYVDGNPTETGWSCVFYEPVALVTEASRNADLNGDGDRDDSFQLGRMRMRSWDTANLGGPVTDRVLCPPIIVQEACSWGSDLDSDGFEDPIFLWDPASGRLRIRMFLLTSAEHDDLARLRTLETTLFLRNGGES